MIKYTKEDIKYFKRDGFFNLECPAGDYTEIKEFPAGCSFWDSIFSDDSIFGQSCRFDNCTFGDYCSFGASCDFTKSCKFGLHNKLEEGCIVFGESVPNIQRQYTKHDNAQFLREQIWGANSEQLSQLIVKSFTMPSAKCKECLLENPEDCMKCVKDWLDSTYDGKVLDIFKEDIINGTDD